MNCVLYNDKASAPLYLKFWFIHTYIYLQFRFLQDLLQEGDADFDTTNVMSAIRVLRKSTITSELNETLGGMRSLFRYFDDFNAETRQFVELQEDAIEVCIILHKTCTLLFVLCIDIVPMFILHVILPLWLVCTTSFSQLVMNIIIFQQSTFGWSIRRCIVSLPAMWVLPYEDYGYTQLLCILLD